MSRLHRAWQIAAVALTAIVSVWTIASHTPHDVGFAAFFAVLILCASFLRIESDESSVAFEAPIVFGAIIIFHDPALAMLAAFVGASLHAAYLSVSRRSLKLEPFASAAQVVRDVRLRQLVVDPPFARAPQHAARQIDAHEPLRM